MYKIEHDSTAKFAEDKAPYINDKNQVSFIGMKIELAPNMLLNALGASVWQTEQSTFAYRWRGEDSLTWGDIDNWLKVEWVRHNLQGNLTHLLIEHSVDFQNIVEKTRLYKLTEMYQYRNADSVQNFLISNPILIDFLKDSYPFLRKHFGSKADFFLEVFKDPEGSELIQLFVCIRTIMPIDQAMERLNAFDEEWFLDQLYWVEGLVNFDLEVV